jgi:spermidine/putrescine transport system substrate-binding protein
MLRKLSACLVVGLLAFGGSVLAQEQVLPTSEDTTWVCPEGFRGQSMTLYNWTDYINTDTITHFETLCDVTVNLENYGSNDELIAKLRLGNPGYDVVVPTGNIIPVMIREELLEPLDLSMIPNFETNISEFLQGPEYDPENMYTVPYQWGMIGVGYNRAAVGGEIVTWEDVWNYEGNVAWVEEPDAILGFALRILGYDPNTSDPEEITAARDYLMDNGGNVRTIAQGDGRLRLQSGEVDIVIAYNGEILRVQKECNENPSLGCENELDFVIPEEGGLIWVDNLSIPVDAPNPALAHAFLDYMLDPVVSAVNSNLTAYATPIQPAIDDGLILEEFLTSPLVYPDDTVTARLFSLADGGDDWKRLRLDAWDEIKVALGQ